MKPRGQSARSVICRDSAGGSKKNTGGWNGKREAEKFCGIPPRTLCRRTASGTKKINYLVLQVVLGQTNEKGPWSSTFVDWEPQHLHLTDRQTDRQTYFLCIKMAAVYVCPTSFLDRNPEVSIGQPGTS
jgi:hypothetical protein